MTISSITLALLSLLLIVEVSSSSSSATSSAATSSSTSSSSSKREVGSIIGLQSKVRIVSPLQSLTIWDKKNNEDDNDDEPRNIYLKKFDKGFRSEMNKRRDVTSTSNSGDFLSSSSSSTDDEDWSRKAANIFRKRRNEEERLAEEAYDKGVMSVSTKMKTKSSASANNDNKNEYQFVGVINSKANKKGGDNNKLIKWYARKKKTSSSPKSGNDWSVRLIHVNRDAIIKDLFNTGKVDIYGDYKKISSDTTQSNYIIKEKSWKTLWNFSPKHFFTDSSGMYHRERRIEGNGKESYYTDGKEIFTLSYNYITGKNGLHPVNKVSTILQSPNVSKKFKNNIISTIKDKSKSPDIVIEEWK